jgi:hypothetical protein
VRAFVILKLICGNTPSFSLMSGDFTMLSALRFFFAMLGAAPLLAQDTSMWSDSQYTYLGSEAMKSAVLNGQSNRGDQRYSARGGVGDRSGYSGQQTLTEYRESPAVTRDVKHKWIDRSTASMRSGNPAGVADVLQRMDIELVYQDLMRPHGLQSQDLADATAGYWITMWTIVNRAPMPPRAAIAGVRAQMYDALLDQGYADEPDSVRQMEAQFLMWKTISALASYRKPGMDLRGLSYEMNRVAVEKGFDLARLRVTPQGFVPLR